jgi:hypothetical protein
MAFDQLVEQHHKLQFQSNFMLATQYMGPKLRPYVTEQTCAGEGAVAADLIQPVKYRRLSGRRRSNEENPAGRTRRWLMYRDPVWTGQYLDSVDKFRQIDDAGSDLMRTHAAEIGRAVDDIILGLDEDGNIGEGGLLGTIVEGKRPGNAPVALDSQYITVHGSVGLTIAKLRKARKKLGLDNVDLDRVTPVMAITTNQHDDLLGIVETGTADLNQLEQPQLRDGKVTRLMGFTFVECNRLPKAGTTRSCPVWLKEKIKLGIWQDIRPRMWNDTHAGLMPYMEVDAIMDSTRVEDLGVHVIECTES